MVSRLGVSLVVKLHKHGRDELRIPGSMLGLEFFNLRAEALDLRPRPVDGIYLLADDHLEAVGRSIGGFHPAGCDRAGLVVDFSAHGLQSDRIVVDVALFLESLAAGGIGHDNELGLGGLELHGGVVAFLHFVLQLLRVGGQPNVLDLLDAEHPANPVSVQVVLSDGSEEHRAGRQPAGICRRQGVGLAQVDVEDVLAGDGIEDETWSIGS